MSLDYKLEIFLQPKYHNNADSPYFWAILEYTGQCWVNTGICGWGKNPAESCSKALEEFNMHVQNQDDK